MKIDMRPAYSAMTAELRREQLGKNCQEADMLLTWLRGLDDEARRHLLAIDDALDTQVGPNAETTLQAVERVRQERDNARADLLVARNLDSTVRGILGIRVGDGTVHVAATVRLEDVDALVARIRDVAAAAARRSA